MSEEKNTICKLCREVHKDNGAQSHHCSVWCEDDEQSDSLKDDNPVTE